MIKRYNWRVSQSPTGRPVLPVSYAKGDWCKYSDAEQLEQEKDDAAREAIRLLGRHIETEKELTQERDELAARVERLESIATSICWHDNRYGKYPNDLYHAAVEVLKEPLPTALQAHDKALLLRLAKVAEDECDDWRVAEWIEQKAEEL